jgi:hypothetical protein
MLTFSQLRFNRCLQVTVAICSVFLAGIAHAQLAPNAVIAGGTVQANEGDFVILYASASADQNTPPTPLTYIWQQLAGPTGEVFNNTMPLLGVTVPFVGGVGGIMTYQVTVTNAFGLSASATTNIQINVVNRAPVASIVQPSQPFLAGSTASLDASASFDPDGDPITYSWQQLFFGTEPAIVLNLANPAVPTFIAPSTSSLTNYRFQLTVSDGSLISTAIVNFQTIPQHHAPVANAGAAETVGYGETVTLDGTASTDPDGNLLTYTWTQTSGTPVLLNYADPAKPTFVAPAVTGPLTFSLTVSDVYLASAPAAVTISVFPPDAIPNCGNAHANKTQLWPPNQTFARIKIRGLEADPKFPAADNSGDDDEGNGDADDPNEDNYRNIVRVASVTQDEPTANAFKGDLSPDAINQSTRPNGKPRIRDLTMLRRENVPGGDGRVYTINFTATNTLSGATCNGAVTVCAPTKRGKNGQCVNSGQNYNSFQK